jgi:Do/DeqQ family serine protease
MFHGKRKQFLFNNLITAIWVIVGLGVYHWTVSKAKVKSSLIDFAATYQTTNLANPTPQIRIESSDGPNFVHAAQKSVPAVVHITVKYESKLVKGNLGNSPLDQLFKEFFGEGFEISPKEYKSQPSTGFGSGVIITEDGYIVTNNHVVEGADQIEVTLDDNRRYTAKIVGTDVDTDLALLKIEEKGLPYLLFGDSDKLRIGDWVLAVGNPFNLTSTVTKGIVSAKARRADIYKTGSGIKIESFIQTDAPVNKGNSGGALVNLEGELVGINTAISTPTGAFAGYSFAIPSSIVERVVHDLRKYGTVQRAILGIFPQDVNADLVAEKKLKRFDGVYVAGLAESSAAREAGLKEGDIIVAINDTKIKKLAQLHEQLARYQPNDNIQVTFDRKGKEHTVTVKLKNALNEVRIPHGQKTVQVEGAIFENVDKDTEQKLGIKGGVQIKALKAGKWQEAGIKKGFIMLAIDQVPLENLDQLANILNTKKGGMLVEGIYPNGVRAYYGLGWGDK